MYISYIIITVTCMYIFVWLVALNKVNKNDVLQRRPYRMISPNIGLMCTTEAESVSHLFMHCKFDNAIWSHFFSIMRVNWVMPREALKLICQWNSGFLGVRGWILWKIRIHRILWGIWIERNRCIFEDKRKGLLMVVEWIKL